MKLLVFLFLNTLVIQSSYAGNVQYLVDQDKALANYILLNFKPPVPGSETDVKDLDAVRLRIRQITSPEECLEAQKELIPDLEIIFGKSLEKIGLNQQSIKAIDAFFYDNIRLEVDSQIHTLKKLYARPRPFQRDNAILEHQQHCMEAHPSASYPSGHAALAKAEALFLTDLFPEHAKLWQQHADKAADHRVLAGVHHPADTKDGAKIAEFLYQELKQNTKFQIAFKKLKEQL